jgi:starch phosphorylase
LVRDYVQGLYLPAARRSVQLTSDGYAGARRLAEYRGSVEHAWHEVHVDSVDADESVADLGASRRVSATVALGSLQPDQVEVQLISGHVGQSGELESVTSMPMDDEGAVDERHHRFGGDAPLDVAGRMGVTVRVVPRHDLVDAPTEFGLVAWAD